jgi:hypothetical protein
MKALATGRRVSKRPFCALAAALLVLVPGLARARRAALHHPA